MTMKAIFRRGPAFQQTAASEAAAPLVRAAFPVPRAAAGVGVCGGGAGQTGRRVFNGGPADFSDASGSEGDWREVIESSVPRDKGTDQPFVSKPPTKAEVVGALVNMRQVFGLMSSGASTNTSSSSRSTWSEYGFNELGGMEMTSFANQRGLNQFDAYETQSARHQIEQVAGRASQANEDVLAQDLQAAVQELVADEVVFNRMNNMAAVQRFSRLMAQEDLEDCASSSGEAGTPRQTTQMTKRLNLRDVLVKVGTAVYNFVKWCWETVQGWFEKGKQLYSKAKAQVLVWAIILTSFIGRKRISNTMVGYRPIGPM